MFEQELLLHTGEQVTVVTPAEHVSGILLAATDAAVAVRTAQYPGYGGAEDVTVSLDMISYVRIPSDSAL
ncbi:hypothetical protein SD70_26175 [Gordoniibacillus kamchatkensis]|uniref:Uncharacterized protein n=1 Tax=Gordoniibacillus kamchatkensis TaxID=1590651 RepID=A0ABR5ABP9_9BACL|nr:hypothetical protein [Paenibacillus sp. VKM B-2647]KIL38458.1 hypothetical protein SD70_26175 [Paenibacillus sp. VKM B-2647]